MQTIVSNSRIPDISFSASGLISLSRLVVDALSLKPGDVLDIAVMRGEYYLYVKYRANQVRGKHRGRCFLVRPNSTVLRCSSVALCRAVLDKVGVTDVARLITGDVIDLPLEKGKGITLIMHAR